MKKEFIIAWVVLGCLLAGNSSGNVSDNFLLSKEAISIANGSEAEQLGQPQPKPPRNKGLRRMRNKIFTVNVFSYNKKIREKRDKDLKRLSKTGKKSSKAHKANKKTKHILLRGSDGNHGFKNKRRW